MKIFIQNMVSLRCKLLVRSVLEELNISYKSVELGEVQLVSPISDTTRQTLREKLHKSGLEVMDDRKAILIEQIINVIVEMVHYSDEVPKVNFSTFLSQKLQQDYHKIAALFSRTKGVTIEHFIIIHKVERIKELITYDELNLTEIADLMHYSSVAHLSKQFRQITGLTPSAFRRLSDRKRLNLEDL